MIDISNKYKSEPNIDDLGISRKNSSRWQLEANVDEEIFDSYINESITEGREITSSRLLKIARSNKTIIDGKYNIIERKIKNDYSPLSTIHNFLLTLIKQNKKYPSIYINLHNNIKINNKKITLD